MIARRSARPSMTPVTEHPPPILVAIGLGGRIELTAEHVRLQKGGVFGHAVELLWLGHGVSEKSIPVWEIAAVEIVKPILLPDFIRFSYPGSPSEHGRYLDDSLAENALIMNLIDNRAFYAIKDWIERWPTSLASLATAAAAED
jgi:hypothetical protein